MKLDKELVHLIRLVMELKRRHLFMSLLITNTGIRVGYWDKKTHKPIVNDPFGARLYINGLIANERAEVEEW